MPSCVKYFTYSDHGENIQVFEGDKSGRARVSRPPPRGDNVVVVTSCINTQKQFQMEDMLAFLF